MQVPVRAGLILWVYKWVFALAGCVERGNESKRHPGRFGHIVAEIIQDIVSVGVVAINGIGLVIMAAVLAKYVPYKHFYHVVGNVVVYACLAAAIGGAVFCTSLA